MINISFESHPELYQDFESCQEFLCNLSDCSCEYPDEVTNFHVYTEVKNEKENIEQALINYQNKRMLRTARVQLHSREIGKHVYHADGVHALLRNQIMKSKIYQSY